MSDSAFERLKAPALAVVVWVLYIAGFGLHIFVRGWADDIGPHAISLAGPESVIFSGEPSVWLQRWTPDEAYIWKTAAQLHATWFYVPILLALLVQVRQGTRVVARLLGLQLVLLFSTDVAFTLMPTRPPWMDFELVRIVAVAYGGTASIDSNPVAAMPSLHVAVPALYTLWFARSTDQWQRRLWPLLALWTVGVAWTVVYGGEHYMIDAMAGILWAAAVWLCYESLSTWMGRRQPHGTDAVDLAPTDQHEARAA